MKCGSQDPSTGGARGYTSPNSGPSPHGQEDTVIGRIFLDHTPSLRLKQNSSTISPIQERGRSLNELNYGIQLQTIIPINASVKQKSTGHTVSRQTLANAERLFAVKCAVSRSGRRSWVPAQRHSASLQQLALSKLQNNVEAGAKAIVKPQAVSRLPVANGHLWHIIVAFPMDAANGLRDMARN